MAILGIQNTIGNTPLVRLRGIERKHELRAELYGKAEGQSPGGSVKDRTVDYILRGMLSDGIILKDRWVVEATSGSVGIALAMLSGIYGYKAMIVMPEDAGEMKKRIIGAYGATLIMTDKREGMQGATRLARELTGDGAMLYLDQFNNPRNPEAHEKSTGREICEALPSPPDALVAGIGSGGTLTGAARYIKGQNPRCYTVGVEPSCSPFLSLGWRGRHGISGIGAGFLPSVLDTSLIDEYITVSDTDARESAKELAKCDGILAGISSGAALAAAISLARRPDMAGRRVVVILPDRGERYLVL